MAENEIKYAKMEQAANNTILLVVARMSMALALPVLGAISTIGAMYLDQKFAAQETRIEQQKLASDNESRIQTARIERIERMATVASENAARVGERLISVETKQTQESILSSQFQQATLARLDKMQESIISLSNSIASLTATLQAREAIRNSGGQTRSSGQ